MMPSRRKLGVTNGTASHSESGNMRPGTTNATAPRMSASQRMLMSPSMRNREPGAMARRSTCTSSGSARKARLSSV